MNTANVAHTSQEDSPGLSLSHKTFIHADPAQVYQALTTSDGLDAWFTTGSAVNAVPGGEIHFRWEDWGPDHISTEDTGSVLEAIPPRRFVFQWHPELPEYATTVEINLAPSDGGTIISLHESGFTGTPAGISALANCASGWGEALTLLKFYLEYGLRY